jgi:predicted TIM-barrel fold metal-dependent hydrolase
MNPLLLALAALQNYDGPLYDAHLHGSPDTPLKDLVELQKKAGIERTVVFLGPRAEAMDGVATSTSLLIDPSTRRQLVTQESVEWLQKNISRFKAVGELALRHRKLGTAIEADGPILKKIYDLAAKHEIPVILHVESSHAAELERALAYNRATKIIWAHAGDAAPALLRAMIKKHENLYADLSCRNPIFNRGFPQLEQSMADNNGKVQPAWKKLLEDYPDRFLFGSDVGGRNPERNARLSDVVKYYRSVFGQIDANAAKKIAHENAEAFFGK